jgi:hypothetical protein
VSVYRYPWPASALTPADMAKLHAVRESSHPRVPITDLIAHAVRQVYSQQAVTAPDLHVLPQSEISQSLKEAA